MIKSSISFPLWIGWQYPKNISRLLVKEYVSLHIRFRKGACFVLTNFAINEKCIWRTISSWLEISKGSYFIVILYDFIYKWKLYSLLKKLSVFGTFQKEGRLSKMTIPSSNWLIKLYRTKKSLHFSNMICHTLYYISEWLFRYRYFEKDWLNIQYYICLYFIVASKIFFSCKVKEPVVHSNGVA